LAIVVLRAGLEELLRQLDVPQLFVCGVATEYCVRATVIDGLAAGFATYVITDAGKA
jgi:nicotinamidase/pyrazinamidase